MCLVFGRQNGTDTKLIFPTRATIGADFSAKVVNWNENLTLRLQLWDIAGQDIFTLMSRSFYKDAVGSFVVSDLTRLETLDSVIAWKEELDSKVQLSDGSKIPCFLLGNKVSKISNFRRCFEPLLLNFVCLFVLFYSRTNECIPSLLRTMTSSTLEYS